MSSPKIPTMMTGPHAMIPFMDANHKRAIANTVFEMAGGVARLAHEADKDFRWFIENVWVKTMPRGVTTVDSGGGSGSVDDLVDRLERLENGGTDAVVINGKAREREDAA